MRKIILINNKIIATIVLLCIFTSVSIGALPTYADEPNCVHLDTGISIDSFRQGTDSIVYARIDSLENIAALNISIYYNPDIISVTSPGNYADCLLYDVNNEPGVLSFSYIFSRNNNNYWGDLFYFRLLISKDAPAGNYYFDLVINEAYDFDLNPCEVKGMRLSFNIPEVAAAQKTCRVYGASDISSIKGEEFTLIYTMNTTQIACGSFVIDYDRDCFEVVSVSPRSLIENMLLDINTALPGVVYVSFAGNAYGSYYDCLDIRFKTIANIDSDTRIVFTPESLYDLALNEYSCNTLTTTVHLSYDIAYDDNLPNFSLISEADPNSDQLTITAKLDADSKLGAGDFIISWNKDRFSLDSYTKLLNTDFFNVNDKSINDGILKFSIISMNDITNEEDVLSITFDVSYPHDTVTETFGFNGSVLADSLTNPIAMNINNCTYTILGRCAFGQWAPVAEPTCTEEGIERRVCTECGNEEVRYTNPLGHDFETEWTIEKAATCTEEGIKYHRCSRCSEVSDVTVIPIDNDAHEWGEWVVTRGSTFYMEGEETRHCLRNNSHIETRAIPKYYKGDFDFSGQISVMDALLALRIAAGLDEQTELSLAIMDIDRDGMISVSDALQILRRAARLISEEEWLK